MNEFISVDHVKEAFSGVNWTKVLEERRSNLALAQVPVKLSTRTNYEMDYQKKYEYTHSQSPYCCHIGFLLNHGNLDQLAAYLMEEKLVFETVFENINNNAFNFEYAKRFLVIRNTSSNLMLKETRPAKKYLEFCQELNKNVYKNRYDKTLLVFGTSYAEVEREINSIIDKDTKLLTFDLLNDSILSNTICISEIMDKLTDDEIQSCFILSSHIFLHPLNWLLSPAVLALSFFHSQLIGLKKPRKDEPFYTKQSLPKVTYLSLTGIYSEIDIDILHAFSENVQAIIIYDESTGGPNILKEGIYTRMGDLREKTVHFTEISDKLLLLPLKYNESKRKSYTPNDIITIIEKFVIPSIQKFKPSYIVANLSFIFEEENSTPFYLDVQSLGFIVEKLIQVCDCKVLIYPFKLPNLLNPKIKNLVDQAKKHIEKIDQRDRLERIFQKYALPYNQIYLRDCLINIFEILSRIKDQKTFNRDLVRKSSKVNPLANETINILARYYRKHTFYNLLYSKEFGVLARLAQSDIFNLSPIISGNKNKTITTIPLYNAENDVKIVKLAVSSDNSKEIVLNENSAYLINYDKPNEPFLYVLNAKMCDKDDNLSLRTYGPLSHFIVYLEKEDVVNQYSVSDYQFFKIENDQDIEVLKNSGICIYQNFLFQVYGTKVDQNEDSNRIFYFDVENNKRYEIKTDEETEESILPRHSVTACAFKMDDTFYLYVFGGQFLPNATIGGKSYGGLEICDIVEVYHTNDPLKSVWTYNRFPKANLTQSIQDKPFSFIPFLHSFAWFNQSKNRILIMGGKMFEESVFNWVFPVYEFDVKETKFTSFHIILNDIKDNPQRNKVLKNNKGRLAIPRAIASLDKNMYFNPKEESFSFVIPLEDENFVCLYTYNPNKQSYKYTEIQVDEEEFKAQNFQNLPLDVKSSTRSQFGRKYVPLPQRLSELLRYSLSSKNTRNILLEMIKWRLEKKEEKLTREAVQSQWAFLKQKTLEKETRNKSVITLNKELEDVFIAKDSRLDLIKDFLEKETFDNDFQSKILFQLDILKTCSDSAKSLSFSSQGSILEASYAKESAKEEKFSDFQLKVFSFLQKSKLQIRSICDQKIVSSNVFDDLMKEGEKILDKKPNTLDGSTRDSTNLAADQASFSCLEEFIEALIEIHRVVRDKLEENQDITAQTPTIELVFDELKKIPIKTMESTEDVSRGPEMEPTHERFEMIEEKKINQAPETQVSSKIKDQEREQLGSFVDEAKTVKPTIYEEKPVYAQEEQQKAEFNPKPSQKKRPVKQTYDKECQTLEEELDIVKLFKKCIAEQNKYHVFFNSRKSQVILFEEEKNQCSHFMFKVIKPGQPKLEDISFDASPSSIWVIGNALMGYIDTKFKERYSDVYKDYRYWILFADLGALMSENKKPKYLVFRKLFEVAQDTHISSRCLVITNQSVLLFGGKSYKFKGRAKSQLHKEVLRYALDKYSKANQSSTSFKDSQSDEMESNEGECVALPYGKLIYVCNRYEPTSLEIFDEEGIRQEDIEIPEIKKCSFVTMTLVNFRNKPEILFGIFNKDEYVKCLLFDIEKSRFEEKEVVLVSSKVEGKEEFKMFYSGFEEIEVSCSSKQLNRIFVYISRSEEPEVIPLDIKVMN